MFGRNMVWLRHRRADAQLVGRSRRDLHYFRRGLPRNTEALACVRDLFRRRGQLSPWWATISPAGDRDWDPEVARTLTATIDSDRLVVSNVRNFAWRSEQRTYVLSRVRDVDLIMSYWLGEAIAHTIVSFGFDSGSRLAFSI